MLNQGEEMILQRLKCSSPFLDFISLIRNTLSTRFLNQFILLKLKTTSIAAILFYPIIYLRISSGCPITAAPTRSHNAAHPLDLFGLPPRQYKRLIPGLLPSAEWSRTSSKVLPPAIGPVLFW